MRSISFVSPQFIDDPWPSYAQFRTESPVWWAEEVRMYCVFRHRDIRTCLTSDDYTVTYPFRVSKQVFGETLLDLDGEKHKRLRRPLAGLLLGRHGNQAFRSVAEDTARETVAALRPGSRFDFVERLARRVPLRTTATFLGVPRPYWDSLLTQVEYLVGHLDGSSGEFAHADAVRAALHEELARLIREDASAGSMLGEIGGWVREGLLSLDEGVGLASLTLAAGFETSAGLLSNALVCMADHPGPAALAKTGGAPLRAFLSEVLRMEPPQHDTVRFAVRDTVLAGVEIPAGSALKLLLASGNRDPEVFADPDLFDPGRPVNGSLAFGHGAHSCLGMHIAAGAAEAFLGTLFARFPSLRIADHPRAVITGSTFRRPAKLFVELGSEGPASRNHQQGTGKQ
jgi:cytochrome P450